MQDYYRDRPARKLGSLTMEALVSHSSSTRKPSNEMLQVRNMNESPDGISYV